MFKGKMSFNPGAFSGVGNEFEYLWIGYTLQKMPDDAFNEFDHLREVYLSDNHLKTVSQRTFGYLSQTCHMIRITRIRYGFWRFFK